MVSGQTGARNGEWPHWGADLGNTKYSALDQINRDNVKNLRVAWRWKADNFGPRPQNNLEATPLMVGGVLYTTAGTRPSVAAIDGATGETLWTYRFDEGPRGDMAPRSVSRGVEYWTDGKQQRIILITRGYRMVSLDAKTGLPDPAFGTQRRRRSLRGLRSADSERRHDQLDFACRRGEQRRRGRRRASGGHRTALEGEHEGLRSRIRRAERQAHLDVPHDSASRRIRQRHLAERFVGLYGQHGRLVAVLRRRRARLRLSAGRVADRRFLRRPSSGQQPVCGQPCCLDAKTGKRVWHQQLVHHDIWDYDIASPPI